MITPKPPKRRKDAPQFPVSKHPKSDAQIVVTAKKANTLRRQQVVAAICARTRVARTQIDRFTRGVDMSDLSDYPVMTQLEVPVVVRVQPPKVRTVNDARVSAALIRKPSPVRTRTNRCTYCDELGHNARGCFLRKEFEGALRTARAA